MNKTLPHPCITCITFVMCQSRLQTYIRNRILARPFNYYNYVDDKESSHSDLIMIAFYSEIATCDIIQKYIRDILEQKNPSTKEFHIEREAITVEALYDGFNIVI